MGENNSKSSVPTQNSTVDGNFKTVSLASSLGPSQVKDENGASIQGEAKQMMKEKIEKNAKRPDTPKEIISALGSEEKVSSIGDCGLFAAILTAYNNHWILRTSPDDWWFCVIKRVASVIGENSKKKSVRKMFVEHKKKKTIEAVVENTDIYSVDESWLFDQMAKGIKENIKVPEFVDGMTADFSTTTAVQKIVSQITLMYSDSDVVAVQEYFEYGMMLGCGIPAVEMLGTEDDWSKLTSKLKALRTLLEPIESDLGFSPEWWDLVDDVFCRLLATYQGSPDSKWWSHVMSYEKEYSSGMDVDGKYRYRGWITWFLEGRKTGMDISEMTSGLVSVPLTLKHPSGAEDTAQLVTGMLGFTVHNRFFGTTSVQPFQGWSLMLSKDSPFLQS